MKAIKKNIFREIQKTKSRFISILAIIAISTGFFTGVKTASPSMIETGKQYFENQNLMDLRLVSTVGFDEDDIKAIKSMKTSVDVMPGYFSDLIITQNQIDTVVRVYSLPEKTDTNDKIINEPVLVEGRLPKADGECVIESYYYKVNNCKIGDKITFNETLGSGKTTDIIKNLEYKIVGVISSPTYITYSRENTNRGSGMVEFFIMLPSDQFLSERYSNVYVTTAASNSSLSPFSEEYKNTVERQSKEYETLSEKRISIFNDTTLKDAKTELADAKKEFADKKNEADVKIKDGEKKLHDGERELQSKLLEGEKKLDDAEKQVEDGKKELEKAQEEYTKGIEDAKNKLTIAEQQHAYGKEQYTIARHTYDIEMEKAQTQLDQAQNEFDIQYSIFYGTTKPQAETKLTLLKTGIDLCGQTIAETEKQIASLEKNITFNEEADLELSRLKDKLTEYKNKLSGYQQQYDDGINQLTDGEQQLNEAKEKLASAKQEFQIKKSEASDQLNNAQIQLDNAQSQLEIGKLEYNTALTSGAMQLQAAQSRLTQGQEELKNGIQEMESQKAAGMQMLKESREKLSSAKIEAKIQLENAEHKLNDAQDTIDTLNDAKWIVYDRDDNPGYSGLEEDALRVDNMAAVFPVFFLLVAALVSLTTMSRMVEERRTEIGTLKALGYTNKAIAAKYFVYAASAAVIGSVIGAVIGVATLPYIILDTYSIMYTLPNTVLILPWDSFFFSAGTGILCTCAVAVFTCLKELRIKPATLMRPKAPKPGKRILLEYITPIWSKMNFTSKVTARNIFRYKARFLMTVIGVAGCTALMIGGFGLKDSISVIADRQYKEISIYDQVYALSESGTAKEKKFLMSQFHADKRFKETLLVSQTWTNVEYGSKESIGLRTIIGQNNDQFEKIFTLRNRETHQKIKLKNNGAVINERLGEVIGKGIGDTFTLTINDHQYKCRITGLSENYAGNFIYMSPEYYQSITGKEPQYNLVYTQLADDARSEEHDIANEWMKNDDIVTVSLLQEQLDSIVSTLDSLNVIVLVLIFCAGLLAVVVLYNLTNINIAERVREIATIKVLGFYNMETANYIYRENTILTITGALAGLPLGILFSSFIVMELQMDSVMFPQYINPISFVWGFLLTILFSLLVNFIMFFKMKKISMVESLKSIE